MKKKNILGTTITVTVVFLSVLLEVVVKTIGFFWVKLLEKLEKLKKS
jgi:hypothetical protein